MRRSSRRSPTEPSWSISTGKTLDSELGAALGQLEAVRGKALGVIFNRVPQAGLDVGLLRRQLPVDGPRPGPDHDPHNRRIGRHAGESSTKVTGPSLTSATCMSAPNLPARDGRAESFELRADLLVDRLATSPGAAAFQVGRRPLRASPYSVNWLTTRTGASDVGGRPLVAQDPQLPDLARHPGDLGRPVVVGDPEQHQQARTVEPTDHLVVDPAPRPRGTRCTTARIGGSSSGLATAGTRASLTRCAP